MYLFSHSNWRRRDWRDSFKMYWKWLLTMVTGTKTKTDKNTTINHGGVALICKRKGEEFNPKKSILTVKHGSGRREILCKKKKSRWWLFMLIQICFVDTTFCTVTTTTSLSLLTLCSCYSSFVCFYCFQHFPVVMSVSKWDVDFNSINAVVLPSLSIQNPTWKAHQIGISSFCTSNQSRRLLHSYLISSNNLSQLVMPKQGETQS